MTSNPTTTQLPDGAIRVCVGSRCGTVSSWHLVPGKTAQLHRMQQQPQPTERTL